MQQGRMAGIRDQAVALLNEVKMTGETSAKVDLLKTLMELVLHRDPSSLLPEFVPYLMELQTEPGSPVRKYLAECVALPYFSQFAGFTAAAFTSIQCIRI